MMLLFSAPPVDHDQGLSVGLFVRVTLTNTFCGSIQEQHTIGAQLSI